MTEKCFRKFTNLELTEGGKVMGEEGLLTLKRLDGVKKKKPTYNKEVKMKSDN